MITAKIALWSLLKPQFTYVIFIHSQTLLLFVNRIREMVSFELVREIEKGVFNSEESNLRPSDSALRCPTTEPQRLYGEQGLLLGISCDKRLAYSQDQQCR